MESRDMEIAAYDTEISEGTNIGLDYMEVINEGG